MRPRPVAPRTHGPLPRSTEALEDVKPLYGTDDTSARCPPCSRSVAALDRGARQPSPPWPPAASADHLADAADVFLGQPPGVRVGIGLRPDVGDRLLGIRECEGPPVAVVHLHPVDQ